jgi:Ca2+-binding RTX toxin-like protein
LPTWTFNQTSGRLATFATLDSVIFFDDGATVTPRSLVYSSEQPSGVTISLAAKGTAFDTGAGGAITDGTIRSLTLRADDQVLLRASGLNMQAATLARLIDNPATTTTQFQAFVLKGNDRITGTDAPGIEELNGWNGNDTILGKGSSDMLYGGNGRDSLMGGDGSDNLYGGKGNDLLVGGAGSDALTGGKGRDVFLFDTAPDGISTERLNDFDIRFDRIHLDVSAFDALEVGELSADAFAFGTATTLEHRIIFAPDAGGLLYDADGIGTAAEAILFAGFLTPPDMTAADFLIIA